MVIATADSQQPSIWCVFLLRELPRFSSVSCS
jgi:hypothetical protein